MKEVPRAIEVPEPVLPSWEVAPGGAKPLDEALVGHLKDSSVSLLTLILLCVSAIVYVRRRFTKS